MTRPELVLDGLKKAAAWEYALRFAFGGVITVCTGLVSKHYGPAVGGLFLAFPAILPASLTLVKQHDGRACAADGARGARLGAIGLASFAVVVAATAEHWPPALVLVVATLAWLVTAVALWALVHGRR